MLETKHGCAAKIKQHMRTQYIEDDAVHVHMLDLIIRLNAIAASLLSDDVSQDSLLSFPMAANCLAVQMLDGTTRFCGT